MRMIIPVIQEHIIMSRDDQVCTNSYAKISSFTTSHISNDTPRCSLIITAVYWQYRNMRLKLTYPLYEFVSNRCVPAVIDAHTIDADIVAEIVVIPVLINLIVGMCCRNRDN